MKILVVEDIFRLQELITLYLKHAGFAVDAVSTAQDAINALLTTQYNALVLDLGLPDLDGAEVLKAKNKLATPPVCLILSARDSIKTRVELLNAGADDYLLKPFDFSELEARIHALLRRSSHFFHQLQCGNISFEPSSRYTSIADQAVHLSRKETMLLEEMLRIFPRIAIKDSLEERLYSQHEHITLNAIEALVSRLRRKFKQCHANVAIETVRGIGYRLVLLKQHE